MWEEAITDMQMSVSRSEKAMAVEAGALLLTNAGALCRYIRHSLDSSEETWLRKNSLFRVVCHHCGPVLVAVGTCATVLKQKVPALVNR